MRRPQAKSRLLESAPSKIGLQLQRKFISHVRHEAKRPGGCSRGTRDSSSASSSSPECGTPNLSSRSVLCQSE
eukprot:7384135-Prymnesium_polylepis.1